MVSVGAYEAKTRLSELLDRVAGGECITITRHGVPVAILQPVVGSRTRPAREVIDELRRFRRGKRLRDLTVRQLIEDGRR